MMVGVTVKQRLVHYLKYKKIGQNKFEKLAGLGNGYIAHLRHTPTPTKIEHILAAAPDLNRVWLLSGVGDMLLPDHGGNVVSGVTQGNNSTINNSTSKVDDAVALRDMVAGLKEHVRYLMAQCEAKDKERERLMAMIEKLIMK